MKKILITAMACLWAAMAFANHWTPNSDFESNMTITAIVQVNGVEQSSEHLELGVFCGDECRGAQRPIYIQALGSYVYFTQVFGQATEAFLFKLYDHSTGEELVLASPAAVVFNENGYGSLSNPHILNFTDQSVISFTITTSPNPAEGGTVTGAGVYANAELCSVVATAHEGYAFQHWTENGNVVSASEHYSFAATADRDLVAHFVNSDSHWQVHEDYELDMTLTGVVQINGVEQRSEELELDVFCGDECRGTQRPTYVEAIDRYVYFTQVYGSLSDVYSFKLYDHGSGAVLDLVPPEEISFEENGYGSLANLQVLDFTGLVYPVNVEANFAEGGVVTGDGTYNPGAFATLTATPNEGYAFVNWMKDGEVVSSEASISFTVDEPMIYYVNYLELVPVFDITVIADPTNGGTVTGGGSFEQGQSCTLTASAKSGYAFSHWSKNDVVVSTESSYTFIVNETATYAATFTLNTYEITVTSNPDLGGVITGAGIYSHGTRATLTANANEGYSFVNWTRNGSVVSTNMNYGFTVTGSASYVANFSLNSYQVAVTADPETNNTVTGGGTYDHGTTVVLTATAGEGYAFQNWTANGVVVSTTENYSFAVVADCELVAHFIASDTHWLGNADYEFDMTLTAIVQINEVEQHSGDLELGVFCGDECRGAQRPTYIAALDRYVYFTQVYGLQSDVFTFKLYDHAQGMELDLVPPEALSYNADGYGTLSSPQVLDFYDFVVQINVAADPEEGGTVSGDGTYDFGTMVELKAVANEGYNFINWTKDGNEVSTDADYSFTAKVSGDYIAHFELKTYEITASADPEEGGTITGAGTYTHGETVTLTATASEGYLFDGWVKDEETVSTEPSLSFTATEDGEYVAHFTLQSYPIEITAFPTEGGMVTGAGTYYHGDICTLTATPNTGYVFLYWIKDGVQVSTEASYTFTVTGPATYVANFVNFNYEVSVVVNPAEAGTVQGAGNYDLGLTCTLTATPNEGYQFVNWTVNGEEVSSDLEYSFTVTEPVAVEANFRIDAEFHEFSLTPGWNWWSTYIEMNGVNGLALLEDALGASGIQIKSQSSFVTYDEGWFGMLNGIVNEQSYRINMGEGGDYSLAGTIADPTAHPIAIGSGWNWIGYVENVEMDLNTAMANLDKSGDDIVKSRDYFSTYYAGYGWWGTLESLQPGGGYMYKASASGTLVYPEASKANAIIHSPKAATWWNPDGGSYADNMSVMAVVEVNGEEVRSEEVEIGAFSQGECRGAVRLLYVAPLDRYVAFLTVHGKDGDGVSFRLKNDEGVLFARDSAVFTKDAVLGSTAEPYVLRFGNTGVTDAAEPVVTAYPNPSTGVFQLEGEGMERVEVYTMLGELVRMEEVHADTHTLNLSGCAEGVYHLRVHTQNGMRHLSVVVAE